MQNVKLTGDHVQVEELRNRSMLTRFLEPFKMLNRPSWSIEWIGPA
jgi:hypothetical protein